MHPFGSVWGPTGGARPIGIRVDFITKKCQFFLGDHWVDVGPVVPIVDAYGMHIAIPDIDQFFATREHLDDGSEQWRTWGPRVN